MHLKILFQKPILFKSLFLYMEILPYFTSTKKFARLNFRMRVVDIVICYTTGIQDDYTWGSIDIKRLITVICGFGEKHHEDPRLYLRFIRLVAKNSVVFGSRLSSQKSFLILHGNLLLLRMVFLWLSV